MKSRTNMPIYNDDGTKAVDMPVPALADSGKVLGVDEEGKYALREVGGGIHIYTIKFTESGNSYYFEYITDVELAGSTLAELKASLLADFENKGYDGFTNGYEFITLDRVASNVVSHFVAFFKSSSYIYGEKEELTFTTTKKYDTVKIMVWEDLTDLTPVTQPEII